MTINITLPEANNQFLELIQQIKTGEEVLISESGIIIARISPIVNTGKLNIPGEAGTYRPESSNRDAYFDNRSFDCSV
jgi:antitoxin (DNA-binding transcriptional repressor) of toxin-antitoxin stability system